MVEIASPSQGRSEMGAKAGLWLAHGAQLVWILWLEAREVDAWRPGDAPSPKMVQANGSLSGEDVLPGFSVSLSELFG